MARPSYPRRSITSQNTVFYNVKIWYEMVPRDDLNEGTINEEAPIQSGRAPCQRFDPRMRNIGAGGVYGYLSTARIDDQIHVLHRHCA